MKKTSAVSVWPVIILIGIGAALRVTRHFGWLPLPPNVAPVNSLALIAAAYLPRRWGWAVPLGLMLASDLAIGFYAWPIMMTVYGAFSLSYVMGGWLRRSVAWWRVFGLSLVGSTIFFLLTNAAVWWFGGYYPQTSAGLLAAYVSGLPFFRNTVIGDLGFAAVFFGLAALFMLVSKRIYSRSRWSVYE